MIKSKLTHAQKDEVILKMQETMIELDKQYAEHIKKNLEFVNVNADHSAMQHKLIINLNAQVTILRAVNWFLTAAVGILVGVGSYILFWG
jgi:hypothetical protein